MLQLTEYLDHFDIESEGKKLEIFKKKLPVEIKKINMVRIKIKSLSMHIENIIQVYSSLNTLLLDFIYDTSEDTSDVDISRTILLYSKFLYAKEQTGIKRAFVTNMLTIKNMSNKGRKKLYNMKLLYKTYLNLFLKLSNNDVKNLFYSFMNDKKLLKEIASIENGLLSTPSIYAAKPFDWFKTITKKIDKQNILADTLTKQLISLSASQKADSYKDMVLYIGIMIIILSITLFIIIVIFKNMEVSIKKIKKGILNISKTDVNKYKKISIDSDDEFRMIADALNSISEELIIKQKQNQQINKEIKKEQKKALQSAKAKSEFLANMSHEIRTPLNAILGFIKLLKDESRGRKTEQYVDIIENSSMGLLQIIEDILDFSKIESGKLEIDNIDFNAKKEFNVITHLFDAKSMQKDISLVINIDDNMPQTMNSDPLRIKQVIANLLSNAIKFTNNGKSIYVDINYRDNFLFVSVKDEGIGISQENQKHIFDAFSQEDSSTTRKYGGTGLGLSISYELVKLLGGELKLRSEAGVGSEFYFSIPIKKGKEPFKESNHIKETYFINKKVLLVEDNKANQMLMQIILKKLGLAFDIANDGIEAVEAFKEKKYDLILMDENMPNMNGIEATKHILEYEKQNDLTHTPIIALTANALKGDRERFLEAGMDEYLSKPVNKAQLHEVLNKFLSAQI